MTEKQALYVFEIVEARLRNSSTNFCSQYAPEGWHSKIESLQIADAILDRVVHDSYHIILDGDVSMRERHGIHQRKH